MQRRDVLRSLAAIAAFPFVPRTADGAVAFGRAVHGRLNQGQSFRTLDGAQQSLVAAIADEIIPATDTPGAVDVGVPAFIDLLLTEWYDEADRDRFVEGLGAIDDLARSEGGAPFAELAGPARLAVLRALDGRRGEAGAGSAFGQIKSLTVYGYFTSERVTKEVLRPQIFHPSFDGCAPVGG